jgi:hypothetical protein
MNQDAGLAAPSFFPASAETLARSHLTAFDSSSAASMMMKRLLLKPH